MVVFHTDTLGLVTFSFVYLLIIYADYTLVYQVIEYGKEPSTSRTLKALFAHFIVALAFIAHLKCMLSNPGYVPLPATKIDFSSDLERPDPNHKKKKKQPPPIDAWTVCTKCETYRPPRSHHCKKCKRCVRRMDHHCPWVNNCVGELNCKYFFLFLVYIGVFCLYAIILIIVDWRAHYSDNSQSTVDKVMTLVLFFEAVIFGMFVSAIGLGQTIAVLCDRNALEVHRYGHPMKFPDTPKLQLIQALCGRGSKILWCFPCIAPRIPDPIPPSKYSSAFNSIHSCTLQDLLGDGAKPVQPIVTQNEGF